MISRILPSLSVLSGKRILLAEDLYLLADSVTAVLEDCRAIVVGPFPSCSAALKGMDGQRIDAAVLDVGLSDGCVFPVADKLRERGVPFVFLTGYGPEMVPDAYADAPHLLKPAAFDDLCSELVRLLCAGERIKEQAGDPGRT